MIMAFNKAVVLQALEICGWGLLGIFAVTAVIIGCIYLFNKVFSMKKEDVQGFFKKFKKVSPQEIEESVEEDVEE